MEEKKILSHFLTLPAIRLPIITFSSHKNFPPIFSSLFVRKKNSIFFLRLRYFTFLSHFYRRHKSSIFLPSPTSTCRTIFYLAFSLFLFKYPTVIFLFHAFTFYFASFHIFDFFPLVETNHWATMCLSKEKFLFFST